MLARDREKIANWVGAYGGGGVFATTFRVNRTGGALARELEQNQYDIIVLDLIGRRRYMNTADTTALQNFYASGKSALVLDGSLWIRNLRRYRATTFPGRNGATGGLMINQLTMLAEAGGGILIGTDHDAFQVGANYALRALVPGAQFSGRTVPSTDGDFIGEALLAKRERVIAKDILRHWEAVPSQGEAPVGNFVDFMGRPVTLYSLVETADKPGGGRKRPYVSASIFPGSGRTAIDSDQPVFDNLPTHKSP